MKRTQRKIHATHTSTEQPPGGRQYYCAKCWYENQWPQIDEKKGRVIPHSSDPLTCVTCGARLVQVVDVTA